MIEFKMQIFALRDLKLTQTVITHFYEVLNCISSKQTDKSSKHYSRTKKNLLTLPTLVNHDFNVARWEKRLILSSHFRKTVLSNWNKSSMKFNWRRWSVAISIWKERFIHLKTFYIVGIARHNDRHVSENQNLINHKNVSSSNVTQSFSFY